MALSRKQAVFTFSTSSGGQEYLYDVVIDAQNLLSVRNLRSPIGLILDSTTPLPDVVVTDINEAKGIVLQLLTETEADDGDLVFTGQTFRDATIAAGVLNNTNYRVVYTPPDGVIVRTENKTTTGFRATVAAAYGTPAAPKTVGYVVLVAAQGVSAISGTATLVTADAGEKAITFPTAMATTNYRVVLTPNGFFDATVTDKLKTGFTIVLSYSPTDAAPATIGWDVFVS